MFRRKHRGSITRAVPIQPWWTTIELNCIIQSTLYINSATLHSFNREERNVWAQIQHKCVQTRTCNNRYPKFFHYRYKKTILRSIKTFKSRECPVMQSLLIYFIGWENRHQRSSHITKYETWMKLKSSKWSNETNEEVTAKIFGTFHR